MVLQYEQTGNKTAIYRAYIDSTHRINNWDLVDVTAPQIVGAHLSDRNRKPLYRLAKSKSLWERRIAIIATFYFIRRNQFDDTLAIADLLLNDKEDLMHKAVGWMLREVGKRDQKVEESFLLPHYKQMPRTMLRYAIERFPEPKRLAYLKGEL
jgi:3-methyladenine DNA glycosylase AlkD